MTLFSLTVVAKDDQGEHIVPITLRARNYDEAIEIIEAYYEEGNGEFIEVDSAGEIDGDDNPNGQSGVIEVMGKVYFSE